MTQLFEKNPDQRIVLQGTWEKFKLMQQASEDSPGVRLAYYEGTIEVLMPRFQHESFSEIIGYLVTTFLLSQGIAFVSSGSVTQEREGKASAQADKSYCLGDAKPIPALSIEVIMPFIRKVWTFTTQPISVLLPELLTPFPNRFVRHLDAAVQHHFLGVPIA